MIYTQNDSLAKLNSPLDIDRKRDIIVLILLSHQIMRKLIDILEILHVINVNNMDILRTNEIDIIKLLNKSIN